MMGCVFQVFLNGSRAAFPVWERVCTCVRVRTNANVSMMISKYIMERHFSCVIYPYTNEKEMKKTPGNEINYLVPSGEAAGGFLFV